MSCNVKIIPVSDRRALAPLVRRFLRTGFQVDAQVELMEDLANELMLDTVVKEIFFSTGDIFFEIARRLEAAAAMAEVSAAEGEDRSFSQDRFDGDKRTLPRRCRHREVFADARLISAAAAVLDAAFFHSLQSPQRIYLVGLPKPMCLPVVAENLVRVYFDLRRRILRHADEAELDRGALVSAHFAGKSAMTTWDALLTSVLDRVVRALNEMSDVSPDTSLSPGHSSTFRHMVHVRYVRTCTTVKTQRVRRASGDFTTFPKKITSTAGFGRPTVTLEKSLLGGT